MHSVQDNNKTNNNNVIQLHSVFEDREKVYIVMEKGDGNLCDHIMKVGEASKYISLVDVKSWFKQMLQAVRACHEKNVIHNDLKPENFVFARREARMNCPGNHGLEMFQTGPRYRCSVCNTRVREGRVMHGCRTCNYDVCDKCCVTQIKLIDFGGSQTLPDNRKIKNFFGTINYKAPEKVRREAFGLPADMWAMGCILFTMVFRGSLFADISNKSEKIEELIELGFSHVMEDLKKKGFWDKLCERTGVNDHCIDLMKGLLHQDPDQRLTAKQALKQLENSGPWSGEWKSA